MRPILQIRPTSSAFSATRLARAYRWIRRTQAEVRAGRTMAQLDDRTLRDIGITRRDVAVLVVTSFRR
jgi:uncharacterized protein YjiS (DUF1127 family)